LRDRDLSTSDNRASERSTEEVDVLVDGVAGDGRVAELLDELCQVSMREGLPTMGFQAAYLATKIFDVDRAGSDLQRLLLGSLKVLLLTDVGHECDNLIALFLRLVSTDATCIIRIVVITYEKVLEDAAGVETARVGEADPLCSHVGQWKCVEIKRKWEELEKKRTLAARICCSATPLIYVLTQGSVGMENVQGK
jgi:hypothetical protein